MITLTLTEKEYKEAVRLGNARQDESEAKGRRPDWKDGTERANHIDGAAVEILAAKLLGIPWEARINTFKQADIGNNIECRGTKSNWYGVKVKEDDADERIVVGFRKVDAKTFNVLGWIIAKDAKKPKYRRDPGRRNRWAYFVPEEDLQPMEDIPKDKK